MLPTDDEVHSEREMAKNACLTFQRYYEAHVAMIADECKRTIARERGGLIPPPCPAFKVIYLNFFLPLDYHKFKNCQ